MLGHEIYSILIISSLYFLIGAGTIHKKADIQAKNVKRFHFHRTQDINDLVKNPTALNKDEASELDKLESMNSVFMSPEVSSESQDLSRQGLDPSIAMQISKLDHNFQDIFGSTRLRKKPFSNARQKGDILQGYGEQYNADGSVSLSNSEWPEYQMRETPPMESMRKQGPPLGNMLVGNGANPQVSPQAALNPNLLPGQKSDLGMGMGVGTDMVPGLGKVPGGNPMMSRFVKDGAVDEKSGDKSFDKTLLNQPYAKPGIKNAGFRIPGEFSFKGARKSAEAQEDANFVKNFMSSKKSRTERRRTLKKVNH